MHRKPKVIAYLSLPAIMFAASPFIGNVPEIEKSRIPYQYEIGNRIVVDMNLYTPDSRYPLFLLWDYVRSGGLHYASDWDRHNDFLEGRLEEKMKYDVAEIQSKLESQGYPTRVGDGQKLWWQSGLKTRFKPGT
ncbi:MAG: hypothetical protein KC978_08715 [Candidatus Omnitrophica bacterium]|nr:hypothetical protein [Candidatus Omnitrophota bacterium]